MPATRPHFSDVVDDSGQACTNGFWQIGFGMVQHDFERGEEGERRPDGLPKRVDLL